MLDLVSQGLIAGYLIRMRILTIIMVLLAATAANAQNIPFEYDGTNRQYRIHIPDDLPDEARGGLLEPGVMGPAIRWLCSPASRGHNDLRIVARDFVPPGAPSSV